MFLTVLLLVCVIPILYWIYFRVKYRDVLAKIKHMDEVESIPLFGSGHLFIGKPTEDVFKELKYQFSINGSPCKMWVLTKLLVSVRHSDDIQRVLSSPYCYAKGSGYDLCCLNDGLITAKPQVWRVHRKLLNSTFHVTLLKNFVRQFNEVSKLLVADMKCKVGGPLFDSEPYFGFRMIDLQIKTIFDSNIGDSVTRIIYENNKTVLNYWGQKVLKFYTHMFMTHIYKILRIQRYEIKILEKSFKHIQPLIDSAREKLYGKIKANNGKKETEDDVKNKPELFIHRLVKLVHDGYFTEQQMREHIETMLLAGGDTLTVSLANCMLCLAMNPDAQENCVKEIKEVMGERFDDITVDDLTKLSLLDRTINESLRHIPTVPLIVRKNEKDIELSNNKIIPAHTDILIPISIIHNCKEYWGENASEFNPDNFLPENVENRPPLSFIPFSYGQRNCIAKKFSNNALKIIAAHLMMNYKFSTDLTYDKLKFTFSITTIVINKHMVRIEKRR